ncbi:G [Blacklegged tick chuvirus 2]|uniref:G n=1 Tax=Blacklegged tick chuvirus 2 TaxID=2079604 RepID=A0A2K9YNG0_9VIRU|nr:G [Blacklegged tick chuvirus-2] [Blacklegged tick chuvirus-2]AUW34383.1 G [Blacklegged tick chuvirus-2] [Blacklegged tick chuvirus-2]
MALSPQIVVLVAFCAVSPCLAIIAYDCEHPLMNVTAISLEGIVDCPAFTPRMLNESRTIQLVQMRKYGSVEYNQCLINVLQTISYCGMHSHSSLVSNGVSSFVGYISEEACKSIRTTGMYQFQTGPVIREIKANSTVKVGMVLVGNVDTSGACSGGSFHYGGLHYQNVVVQAQVTVTHRNGLATVDLASGNIILPTGYRCQLSKGQCVDPENGYTFWATNPVVGECSGSQYDVLYEGLAEYLIPDRPAGTTSPPTVVVVQEESVSFALSLVKPLEVCRQRGFVTDHPKLFIIEQVAGIGFTLRKTRIQTENVDLMSYINAKFVYVERHIQGQMTLMYTHIIRRMCETESKLLQTLLALASISGPEFAYAYKQSPGYTAVTRGEVVHLLQCAPVEVSVRKIDRCFHELPVTYRNSSKFVSPKTRILTQFGTEVDCNPLTPTLYRLAGRWYALNPTPLLHEAPQRLAVAQELGWEYKNPHHLARSGIYSSDEIEAYQRRLLFPIEKVAVENTMARAFQGMSPDMQGGSWAKSLSVDDLSHLASDFIGRMWGYFSVLGSTISGLLGFYFLFRILKFTLEVVINAFDLQRKLGWSWKMLACLWNTLTRFVLSGTEHRRLSEPEPEAIPLTEIEEPSPHVSSTAPTATTTVTTTTASPLYPQPQTYDQRLY